LILYGTTDGHTEAIAHAIAQPLTTHGIDTDVIEAGTLDPLPSRYDGIIIAASIHAGRYQQAVERWVREHQKDFGSRPAVFVSVCLAVLQQSDPKVRADLDAIVARFAATTGWQPPVVKHVAGALLYTRYSIFKRWLMKRIVAKAGGATDVSRDYDYTDWDDLRAFAEDFRGRITAAARASAELVDLCIE
jgi:menaquinone-dependent protoporphyrinogen oxidase